METAIKSPVKNNEVAGAIPDRKGVSGSLYWIVAGLAILPYLPSFGYGFVYDDDVQVLANPAILSWHFVPAYFGKAIAGFFSGVRSAHYYRPLFFLWLRLNYFVWGTQAWGWHLANVALHLAASLLVLMVLKKYFRDVLWAAVGAAIFAVHPSHVETVAWVSGCTDSLMAVSLLGSLWLWMKARETGSLAWGIGSLACCGTALLSKETAVILPVVIFFHALLGIPAGGPSEEGKARRVGSALRESIPYVIVTVVYAAVRFFVLHGIPSPALWVSRGEALLTMPSIMWFYARHLVWPWNLSLFYDFPVVSRASSYLFWGPLALLAGLIAATGIWYRRSRDPRIVLAGLWFLLPLVPALYIGVFKQDDFVHDRYLYLPVLGMAILGAWLAESLASRERGPSAVRLPLVASGGVVVALAIATMVEAQPWKDNLALYSQAVRVAPKNSQARNNLASEESKLGRYQEASEVLKALLADEPGLWLANYNYGYVNYRLGNFALAEKYLGRAIRIDPNDADQYIYLGTTYFKEGRLLDAEAQVRQGIARKPDGTGYHFLLGVIEMQKGNLAAAREEMLTELRYNPGSQAARMQLDIISKDMQGE